MQKKTVEITLRLCSIYFIAEFNYLHSSLELNEALHSSNASIAFEVAALPLPPLTTRKHRTGSRNRKLQLGVRASNGSQWQIPKLHLCYDCIPI